MRTVGLLRPWRLHIFFDPRTKEIPLGAVAVNGGKQNEAFAVSDLICPDLSFDRVLVHA
jgi:hypothetical protein